MPIMLPALKSADCIKRYEKNPVLTKDMVPYDSDLVFNAGVIKRNGKYVMLFRSDYFVNKVFIPNEVLPNLVLQILTTV